MVKPLEMWLPNDILPVRSIAAYRGCVFIASQNDVWMVHFGYDGLPIIQKLEPNLAKSAEMVFIDRKWWVNEDH